MAQIFISYARPTERQAEAVAAALRDLGHQVWRDDALPAHRVYADVIEERLKEAQAVIVLWSKDAVRSDWVRAEADAARRRGALVQLSLDGAEPPMPFNQIHCVDLSGWTGDTRAPGWIKVAASVDQLLGAEPRAAPPAAASGGKPPQQEKPSVAVLPFANLSNDPDQDYFVEGMMDEIVTALTRIRSLFVIASGSTMSLRDQAVSPQDAAHRLGVRYVLEGSVRRSGTRIRIAVKLTDAHGGAQIWAERFEDTLEDVFALQDQVATSVAGVIEPTVQAAELRRIARRPIESLGAYDLYLRAAPLRATLRKSEVTQALALLESALAIEPDFAPALAQAAGCHSQMVINRWGEGQEIHRARGLEMAERAIAAGGEDASVLAQTANALIELDNDLDRAAALAERATKLNPSCSQAWFISGLIRLIRGDPDSAVERLQNAARLDPLSRLNEIVRAHIAICRAFQGDHKESLRLFRETTFRTIRIHPILAAVYGHLGMAEEARRELALLQALTPLSLEAVMAVMSPAPKDRAMILEGIARATEDAGDGS